MSTATAPCSHPGSAIPFVSPSGRPTASPSASEVAAPRRDGRGTRAGDTWWMTVPQDVRIALVVAPWTPPITWLLFAVLAAGGRS